MENGFGLKYNEHTFVYGIVKIALVVFFVSDGLNKLLYIATENDSPGFSPSLFSRMIFELVALTFICHRPNRKRLLFIVVLSALVICQVVGMALYLNNYDRSFRYFYHISVFNKYLFAFIVYYFIYKLRERADLITKLQLVCESIFVINSLFVIAGAILNIKLFRSYPFMDYRYGYDGIISAVNESSLFYFIALSYVYYKKFILNRRMGLSVIILVGALFLGTKTIYLFLVSLTLFHFLRVSTAKARFYALFGIACTTAFISVLYENGFLDVLVDYFTDVVNKRGFVTALFSGRDLYLQTTFFENLKYWSSLNYLFGGQDQMNFLIEMDVFDAFSFFGVVGAFLYFVLFFNSVFSVNLKKKFNLFFIGIYFILAALGGHFFASSLNALYLVVFCLFVYNNDQQVAEGLA